MIEQLAMPTAFGSTWAVLTVGHNLADQVFGQSDHQATNKAAPTTQDVAAEASPRRDWAACPAHCPSIGLTEERLLAGRDLACSAPRSRQERVATPVVDGDDFKSPRLAVPRSSAVIGIA
ncbi:hypothetical protein ACFU8W_45905 [Streptomyces sp. NPDC057565]|uniref:hypothetical protein n=1 Tax=Streptomyces sp. NPDC057565 TaxID=3346169 RepID=UPI0036A74F95